VPYTTNVPGTTITAAYGNANIRDQVVTPFATAAARTSAVSSPVQGMLSYRNDLGSGGGFEHYNSAAWVPSGSQLIASTTLGGATATVTWSSIPQVYNSLLIVGLGQSSNANFNNDNTIIFNSDTGANYSMLTYTSTQAALGPAAAFSQGDTSLKWAFAFPGSSYASTRVGGFMVHIPGYTNTTFSKSSLHDTWITDGGTSFNAHKRYGFWKNTSAISTILLTNTGGNFTTGSYFALYGLP
jgi:hypothetical protein